MLRIIHTADVHLGARHDDLGEQAAAQRERQFAAFKATVDLALAEKVDLVLIAGDLFDSNVQPRRSVERVAAELKRLAAARIRTVIIPGHPRRLRPRLDLPRVRPQGHGRERRERRPRHRPDARSADGPLPRAQDRRPRPGLRDQARAGEPAEGPRRRRRPARRHLAHRDGPRLDRHPGQDRPRRGRRHHRGDRGERTRLPRARPLALRPGGARPGAVTYAYSGAPEPVALDQDRAGKVLLVELDESTAGKRIVKIEQRQVGKTRFERVQVDAATIVSQPVLVASLAKRGDPDLVLHARLVGVRPDELDLDIDEIEGALSASFLKVRVRDTSVPALTEGALPSPDTVVGSFIRTSRRGSRELEAGGAQDRGRGAARRPPARAPAARRSRGLAVRIRRLQLRDFRRYRELEIDLAPGLTIVRGPNEAGKSTIQRAIELALTRRVTSAAGDIDALRPWDAAEDVPSVITIDFEEDEDGATKTGTLEKTFAGSKGTVRLDYDGQSITDPTLADQVLAELTGIPTEAFFRSTASVRHHELARPRSRRGRPPRPAAGVDQRRRPRDEPGQEEARQGPPRAEDEGRQEPGPSQGRRDGRRPVPGRASNRATSQLAQLEQDRDTLTGALARRAEAETALVERRALLEKARQAERLIAERDAAQERYERYRQAVEVNEEMPRLAASHPVAQPAAGPARRRRTAAPLDTRARELRAALSGEVNVSFEVAPEPTWKPYRTWSIPLIVFGLILAIAPLVLSAVGIVDLGIIPSVVGAIIAGDRRGPRRSSPTGFAAATSRRPRCATTEIDRRLRGRSEMEAELFQVEQETARRLGTFGLDGSRRRPRTCWPARRPMSPRSTG